MRKGREGFLFDLNKDEEEKRQTDTKEVEENKE
jgi:hypothetical protein